MQFCKILNVLFIIFILFNCNSHVCWSLYVVSLCVRLCISHLLRPRVCHQSPERPPWTENTARGKCLSLSLSVSVCLPSSSHSPSFLSMVVSHAICTQLHTSQHSPCTVPEMKNTLEGNSINSSAFWRPSFNFSMCLFSRGYYQHWSDPLCLTFLESIA